MAILVRAADHHPQHGAAEPAPSDTCAERTRQPQRDQHGDEGDGKPKRRWWQQNRGQGSQRSDRERAADAAAACRGWLIVWVKPQFGVDMGGQRVMGRQLGGDLRGGLR